MNISLSKVDFKDLVHLIKSNSPSIFILSRAEQLSTYNKELLKVILCYFKSVLFYFLKLIYFLFQSTKKLITLSKIPWSKIEACCLGYSYSFPLQFYVALPSRGIKLTVNIIFLELIKQKIVAKFNLPVDFINYIFVQLEMHYSDYDILRHFVNTFFDFKYF